MCPRFLAYTLEARSEKRQKKKWGGGGASERHYILKGEEIFPALKVPRQCPLVLVEVRLGEGKALGSGRNNGLGCGLCYEQTDARISF
jgi:hypothetical protein